MKNALFSLNFSPQITESGTLKVALKFYIVLGEKHPQPPPLPRTGVCHSIQTCFLLQFLPKPLSASIACSIKPKPKATLNNRMFLLCPFYVLFSSVCVLPLENKMKIVYVQKYWKSRSNTQSISPWDSIKYTDNLSYVHIQHIDWPFHTFKNNIPNILGHSTDVIPAWENWA